MSIETNKLDGSGVSAGGGMNFNCKGPFSTTSFTASCDDDVSRTFTYVPETDQVRMTQPQSGFCSTRSCVTTVTWSRG